MSLNKPHIENMCIKPNRKQMPPQKFATNEAAKIRVVRYGLETALCRAPQLWSLILLDIKLLPNVNLLKSKIKHFKCTECSCKLCKSYLKSICMFLQNLL